VFRVPVDFPIYREFRPETGSQLTASITRQSLPASMPGIHARHAYFARPRRRSTLPGDKPLDPKQGVTNLPL
jgi:hypothetical protein